MSEPHTANRADWRFWEAVRAEARATWCSPWLWLVVWLGLAGWAVQATGRSGSADWADLVTVFPAALVCWPAAWLGSDLLSTRFARNADPLREWWPVEFAARAVGRLGPIFATVAIVVFVLALDAPPAHFLGSPPPTSFDLLADAAASTSVLVATGLGYAAVASLLSSLSRRPRRILITIVTVAPSFRFERQEFYTWLDYVVGPCYGVWAHLGAWIEGVGWFREGSPAWLLGTASVLLTVAILAGLWTWWIAARRYRRSRPLHANE